MTDLRAEKEALRERIWARLEAEGVVRFPGAQGRIPNFKEAEEAAARLRALPAWQAARALKCNPDSPQIPVRRAALDEGKTVYMAVPRLRDPKPFIALEPARLRLTPRIAATIKGAFRAGRPVGVADLRAIDLVVAGSVAVSLDGARLGKGGGYSDLEFALARAAGRITERTLVVTTVHPLQIVPDGEIPMTAHDVPVDLVITPEGVYETHRAYDRPPGIRWEELDEEKIQAIPVLRALRRKALKPTDR